MMMTLMLVSSTMIYLKDLKLINYLTSKNGFKKNMMNTVLLKLVLNDIHHKNGTQLIYRTYNDTYKGYKISYIASIMENVMISQKVCVSDLSTF